MSKGQVERKIEITYRWWRVDGKKHIRPSHVPILEDQAMEVVQRQMRDSLTSGELNEQVCVGRSLGEVDYRGHWEVKIKE